jgi:hypothetical protein
LGIKQPERVVTKMQARKNVAIADRVGDMLAVLAKEFILALLYGIVSRT